MARLRSEVFFEKITAAIIRFRWLTLLGVLLVTGLLMAQYSKLTFNSSFEIWFFEQDPAMVRLELFKKSFGNSNFVYIVAETEDVFQPETARALKRMTLELEKETPFLKDITWVGNAEHIVADGENIRIQRIFEDVPDDAAGMTQRRTSALAEKDFVDRYISSDGKAAGILLEFELFPEHAPNEPAPSEKIAKAVFGVLERPEFSHLDLKVVGDPIFEARYNEIAGKETPKVFLMCLAIQAALLFLFSRSPRGILVPLLIVTLSFLWVLGTIPLLGFELDLMIIGLPVILVCVGIADSMHAIAEFTLIHDQGLSRRDALIKALGKIGLACLITCITTADGFLAFSSAPVKPLLHMGIYMPIGVAYAFVLTMLLVPAIFSFGKASSKIALQNRQDKLHFLDALCLRWLDKLYFFIIAHPRKLLVLFVLLNIAFIAGASFVEVESNTARFLSQEVPLRQHMDYIDERIGGSGGLELVLDTGKPDGVKDPAFLAALDALEEKMEAEPLVRKALSLTNVLKKIRRAMHGDKPEYESLPPSEQGVAEYLALYELAGGDQLNKMVTLDYSRARISMQTRALGSAETRYLVNKALEEAHKLFPAGVTITPAGNMDIAKALNDNMGEAQIQSLLLAFFLVAGTLALALRSFKLAMISMLPNVLPVVATLGFMGVFGINMDTILMTVCGMVIGVAIDDTTHMFIRFKILFMRYGRYDKALQETLRATGRPVIFTTLTLCFGFLVLTQSVLTGWIRIGLLAPYAFAWALLGDLLFAGPLLLLLRPFGQERPTANAEEDEASAIS